MEELWNMLSPLLNDNKEKKEKNEIDPPQFVMQEAKLSLAEHQEKIQTTQETEKKLKETHENFEGNIEEKEVAKVFAEYLEHTLSDEQKGTLLAEWQGEELEGIVNAYISMSTTTQVLSTLATWALNLTGDDSMTELMEFSTKLQEANASPDQATRNAKLHEIRNYYRSLLPAEAQQNFQGYVERETNYVNTFAQLRAQDQQQQIQHNPQPAPQQQEKQIPQAQYQEQLYASTQLERAHQVLSRAEPHIDTCPYGWGSKDPEKGSVDCSGLVNWLFKGYKSPGTYSSMQYQRTKHNTIAEGLRTNNDVTQLYSKNIVMPGDLIFWHSTVPKYHNRHGDGIHHVGMIGSPAFVRGPQGKPRLNVLESSGSSGVHYIKNGLPIEYHSKRSGHKSSIRITRHPFVPDGKSNDRSKVLA